MKIRNPYLLGLCSLLSCLSAHAQTSNQTAYYDATPAPAYIQDQLGPFGPQPTSYPVPAGAVYVAPDGLDSNDGASIDTPTTLGNAIGKVTTGSVLVLRGGLYRVGDLTFNKQITIQPYLDERPVLKGSKIADQWVKKGDFWVTKWETLFPQDPPKWYKPERHGPPCIWNGDLVMLDGEMRMPVDELQELAPGKFYCDYTNNEVYIAEDPAGKTLEITAYEYGFVRTHDETADAEGPTILGLDMIQYSSSCVQIDGDDPYRTIEPGEMPDAPVKTRIVNCRFLFTPKTGLSITSPDSYIAYNDISKHGWVGITIRMSHNTIFEHNILNGNNSMRHKSYPAGIKVFNQASNFIIRHNFCDDMRCVAVWYDVGLREGKVINNYFRNCGISVKIEISHRHYIAGNVFEQTRIFLCNSANCLVYNNTFIDSRLDFMRNNRGITWNTKFSFNHAATGPGIEGYHGHKIANNVFAGHPAGGMYLRMEDGNEHDSNFQTEVLANNLFLKEARWIAEVQFQPKERPMTPYTTLADFSAVYGDYLKGNVELNISQDELFKFKDGGDYRLNRESAKSSDLDLPESIAKLLGWESKTCGWGAFAQPRQH